MLGTGVGTLDAKGHHLFFAMASLIAFPFAFEFSLGLLQSNSLNTSLTHHFQQLSARMPIINLMRIGEIPFKLMGDCLLLMSSAPSSNYEIIDFGSNDKTPLELFKDF